MIGKEDIVFITRGRLWEGGLGGIQEGKGRDFTGSEDICMQS